MKRGCIGAHDFRQGQLPCDFCTTTNEAKVSFPCIFSASIAKKFTEIFSRMSFVLNKSLQGFLKISWNKTILPLLFLKERSFCSLNFQSF